MFCPRDNCYCGAAENNNNNVFLMFIASVEKERLGLHDKHATPSMQEGRIGRGNGKEVGIEDAGASEWE